MWNPKDCENRARRSARTSVSVAWRITSARAERALTGSLLDLVAAAEAVRHKRFD
jgi:hypothetical protein